MKGPVAAATSIGLVLCGCNVLEEPREERATCDQRILALAGADVMGRQVGWNINVGTGGRRVVVTYPIAEGRPGFTCTVVDGKLVQLIRSEALDVSGGRSL